MKIVYQEPMPLESFYSRVKDVALDREENIEFIKSFKDFIDWLIFRNFLSRDAVPTASTRHGTLKSFIWSWKVRTNFQEKKDLYSSTPSSEICWLEYKVLVTPYGQNLLMAEIFDDTIGFLCDMDFLK